MSSRNTSPRSKSPEIHDAPIVPPQPVARKEYKEEIPDISTVSDIIDSKSPLLPRPNNFSHAKYNHTSYKQQEENKFCFPKTDGAITERTNAVFDSNPGLPFLTYLNPGCQSCIINTALMSNKGYNGQYILPKATVPILLPMGNDKEMQFNGEINSNKTCHKPTESIATANSNDKSIACNNAQLSSPLDSNGPETFQPENILNGHCSKNVHFKLQKRLSRCEIPVSPDSRSRELRKSEETCEKEAVDRTKFKDMNIMCPSCFRKSCTCDFSSKECNANPLASSDALSSIWEYLKQQDQKIDLIHEKVSNFLNQHASCLIVQPSGGNEFSGTESDIPYILNILEVHSDKIRELQDQISLLKSSEHTSSNSKTDKSTVNPAQTINCVNTQTYNEEIHFPYSHIVYHEQRQKVTTSTSTMTSFTTEKNDKLVYHKQKSIVSNTRDKKESCLPNEHNFPSAKKHLDEENVNSNSQKRKSHKHNSCSPSLKSKQNVSSNSSSDVPDLNDNQVLKTSRESEKKSKRAAARNKAIDKPVETEDQQYPIKLKNVSKNANDPIRKENDMDEKKSSPSLKTAAPKPNSRPSKQKLRNSTSPKINDTDRLRDLGNKKTQQISTSSGTDTEYKSTKQKQKAYDPTELDSEETDPDSEESTTVSKYGLSSKNLSKATKRYLDTYGLRRPGHLSNTYDT